MDSSPPARAPASGVAPPSIVINDVDPEILSDAPNAPNADVAAARPGTEKLGPIPADATPQQQAMVLTHYRKYVWAESKGKLSSWIYNHGFLLQQLHNYTKRIWVCLPCLGRKVPRYTDLAPKGTANIVNHLWDKHKVESPEAKEKRLAKKNTTKAATIVDLFNKGTPSENRAIANHLIESFDKERFRALIVTWIVNANLPFTTAEDPDLRAIFEYLNPSVAVQNAHISDKWVHHLAVQQYNKFKGKVAEVIMQSPGLVHLAFDGWRSDNGFNLTGIIASFQRADGHPVKVVLGLPELRGPHTGEAIAKVVADVVQEFGIESKIGFIAVDNASNNDTALIELGNILGFDGPARRVRCLGHVFNLVVKALLFGKDADVLEQEVHDRLLTAVEEHFQWRKRGPVGKLHNFTQEVHRSDHHTNTFLSIQSFVARQANVDDPIHNHQPVRVVIDNATRWLSQYYMIESAVGYKPFYESFLVEAQRVWQRDHTTKNGNQKKGREHRKPAFLETENRLTPDDWSVIHFLEDLLSDFLEVVKDMQGDGIPKERRDKNGFYISGGSWDILNAYEFLMTRLEEAKDYLADPTVPHHQHLSVCVDLAWSKLNKYYTTLNQSPVPYVAAALHPAYRWQAFEDIWGDDRREWIDEAKTIVRAVWENDYKDLVVEDREAGLGPRLSKKRFNKFKRSRKLGTSRALSAEVDSDTSRASSRASSPASQASSASERDEFDRWQASACEDDQEIEDPIAYWVSKRERYPRLSRMALDYLTAPATSSEPERLFWVAGRMVTPARNRLTVSTISRFLALRSWKKAGFILGLDPVIG